MKNIMNAVFLKFHHPSDPSLLSFFRICFGVCMMIDIPQERGMAQADVLYNDEAISHCSFPLILGMKPFSKDVMIILYGVLFLNAFFITVGFVYRLNAISFTIIYWYFFILDTSTWNNHSYLYGLISFLLCVTNAHYYLSIDGLLHQNKVNADVPHWNYALFRFQVFVVYFYAGLKKTEADWLNGYSMHRLSEKCVFDPLRPFLSNDSIDYWIVHICGFLYDISVGFLLYFDATRILGLILSATFHGLNSMMFNIGLFPYVMMASSFIFCIPKSFKNLVSKVPMVKLCVSTNPSQQNPVCIYPLKGRKNKDSQPKWSCRQVLVTFFCLSYMCTQAVLPYSHFVTQGYNGWTDGLYGYSWDMMVHSFSNQHIRISYKNLATGELGYLKPGVFLKGKKSRWTTQPVMAYQYAVCIKRHLKDFGITNGAVYFDVWKSLNKRFKQRIYNPKVDIAGFPWSPFKNSSFVLPLLSTLSNWRERLQQMKKDLRNATTGYDVVFVADFPGLYLDNYVHNDFRNITIEVLSGKIAVEVKGTNVSLDVGVKFQVSPGEFHRVYTVSEQPSCYYYLYMNKTAKSVKTQLEDYEMWLKKKDAQDVGTLNLDEDNDASFEFNYSIVELYYKERKHKLSVNGDTIWNNLRVWFYKKVGLFRRSFLLFCFSIRNFVISKPVSEEMLHAENVLLDSWPSIKDSSRPELVTPGRILKKNDDKVEL